MRVQLAKKMKIREKSKTAEDAITTTASRSLSDKIVSLATTASSITRFGQDRDKKDFEFESKEEADELEAARFLFNDDDEESRLYRTALKQKQSRKPFQKQEK